MGTTRPNVWKKHLQHSRRYPCRETHLAPTPVLILVKGQDLDGDIINGADMARNGIDIPLHAGSYINAAMITIK
jgi:hypothetical protein